MKRLLGIVVMGLLWCNVAFTFNFPQTLNQYSNENKGIVSSIYILNRCSGALTYLSSMLLKEPDQKKTALIYLDYSNQSIDYASKLYSKHHNVTYAKASEINLERMMKLEQLYREDAKELFLKNGTYLSGHVFEDLQTCVSTLKSIN